MESFQWKRFPTWARTFQLHSFQFPQLHSFLFQLPFSTTCIPNVELKQWKIIPIVSLNFKIFKLRIRKLCVVETPTHWNSTHVISNYNQLHSMKFLGVLIKILPDSALFAESVTIYSSEKIAHTKGRTNIWCKQANLLWKSSFVT